MRPSGSPRSAERSSGRPRAREHSPPPGPGTLQAHFVVVEFACGDGTAGVLPSSFARVALDFWVAA